MERCNWCANTIKSKTGNFCSLECAGAAEELPELVEKNPVRVLARPRPTRRLRFFSLGVLAGAVSAWFLAPHASTSTVGQQPPKITCAAPEIAPQLPPSIPPSERVDVTVTDVAGGSLSAAEIEMHIEMGLLPAPQRGIVTYTMTIDMPDAQGQTDLRALYVKALGADPRLRGTLNLRIKIGVDGKVEWVSRLDGGLSPQIDPQVIKLLGDLSFPRGVVSYNSFYRGPTEATVQIHFGI